MRDSPTLEPEEAVGAGNVDPEDFDDEEPSTLLPLDPATPSGSPLIPTPGLGAALDPPDADDSDAEGDGDDDVDDH